MRAPGFWLRRYSPLSLLLWPFSCFYYTGARVRDILVKPFHSPIPVCCVGNVTMGGSGKTPVVIALVNELQQRGFKPFCLSKGYGGRLKGPVQVDPSHHTAAQVGDEALLLAQHTPTFMAHRRLDGLKAILATKACDIVLMDDGLQNPTIHKDFSILVIDRLAGMGNGYLFPAGPLREPLSCGLRKVQAVVEMGQGEWSTATVKPKFSGSLQGCPATDYPSGLYLAFAGIGYPQKFFTTLQDQGFDLVDGVAFPDHHPYTKKDIDFLDQLADKHQAKLITTAKDWVRLSPQDQQKIIAYPVNLCWDGQSPVDFLITSLNLQAR